MSEKKQLNIRTDAEFLAILEDYQTTHQISGYTTAVKEIVKEHPLLKRKAENITPIIDRLESEKRALEDQRRNDRLSFESEKKILTDRISELEAMIQPKEEKLTGILIRCPKRPYPVDFFDEELPSNALVDESVCKSCSDYPCEAWKMAESWKRVKQPLKIL